MKSNQKKKSAGLIDKKIVLVSVAVNIAFAALMILLFTPAEKTDDFIIKTMLDEAVGTEPFSHLLYGNQILAVILKFLKNIIPFIAWYETFQYATIFISLTGITYLLINKAYVKKSILLIVPFFTFWGYEAYIKLTFTKTAGLAIAAGFFIALVAMNKNRVSKFGIALSCLIVEIGCLFRYKMLISIIPFFAAIAVYEIIILIRNKEKGFLKKAIIRYVIYFAGMFIIAFSLNFFGNTLYNASPEWKRYKEWNELKGKLQDYGWPDYYDNQNEYESLGVSYNDYALWKKMNYGDPDILTSDLMQKIIDIKENEGYEKYFIHAREFFKTYPMRFFSLTVMVLPGMLYLIFMVCLSDAKHKWFILLFPFLLLMALNYYLFCNGRYGMGQVDYSLWLSAALFMVYYLRSVNLEKNKYAVTGLALCTALFLGISNNYEYMKSETYFGPRLNFSVGRDEARYAMNSITEDKNNLYVFANEEYYGALRAYSSFEVLPKGLLDNTFELSSYMYPSHVRTLENYGIDNIYKSLTNDNVYLASSYDSYSTPDTILIYIHEHYDESAYYELVNTVGEVYIYKFRTAE